MYEFTSKVKSRNLESVCFPRLNACHEKLDAENAGIEAAAGWLSSDLYQRLSLTHKSAMSNPVSSLKVWCDCWSRSRKKTKTGVYHPWNPIHVLIFHAVKEPRTGGPYLHATTATFDQRISSDFAFVPWLKLCILTNPAHLWDRRCRCRFDLPNAVFCFEKERPRCHQVETL